jgi:hypothetical protein
VGIYAWRMNGVRVLLSTHVAGDLGEDGEAPSAPATSLLLGGLALLGGLRRRRLFGHGACGSLLALAQADGSKLQPPVGSRLQQPGGVGERALRAVHVGYVGPGPLRQCSRRCYGPGLPGYDLASAWPKEALRTPPKPHALFASPEKSRAQWQRRRRRKQLPRRPMAAPRASLRRFLRKG